MYEVMTYHSLDVNEVFRAKGTSVNGLTDAEAERRLNAVGENKLKEEKRVKPLQIFLRQFKEVVVYILLFATAVSFFLREYMDAYVILGIIVFDAVLGFVQEYKAERAVELLKKLTTLKTKVIRNGVVREILSTHLVPGDVVYLEAGDKVPADIRVFEARNSQTNEASLTGESLPCTKQTEAIGKEVELAERSNMLYSGTIVVRGTAKGVVVETGMNTEVGKIASMIQDVEETKTPLQVRFEKLGKALGIIVVCIAAVVFGIGILDGLGVYDMLLASISLAVAAVPEGLPAVVTICLALSVQRMIKSNALVKKLKSIETLGDVTVICSDKTGTLTKNEMTVTKMYVNNGFVDVTGFGYDTQGEFYLDGKTVDPKEFRLLLEIAMTCNNATRTVGDPTEMALVYAALKGGADRLERVDEIPFDADKKFMVTVHRGFSYYKGAPEVILEMCGYIDIEGKTRRLLERDKVKILGANQKMAGEALRVLAMAYEKHGEMHFVGMTGMIDPPKDNVAEAIKVCETAGIRSVMITGDHPMTAKAIAKLIGLDGQVVVGRELDGMSDEELRDVVRTCSIYARTSSYHKVKILKALQDNGEVVAMTGDGINDAPAIKRADVGIAMSLKGTDVSRDAAQMILTDDNFATIVNAVKHGRVVYDNIKKFVDYLLCANTVEVGVIFFALLLGFPLPLLAIHLLWVNLMTDSWPALALGVDSPDENVMKRKPRNKDEKITTGIMGKLVVTGAIGTIVILAAFYYLGDGTEKARTIALSTLILFELFRAYSSRSKAAFANVFGNKWLNVAVLFSLGLQLLVMYTPLSVAFKIVQLTIKEWATVVVLGSIGYFGVESYKLLKRKEAAESF